MNVERIVARLPQLIHDYPEVQLLYLFGSQVEGEIGPLSDFDFAVLADRHTDSFAVHARLKHALHVRLELQRLDLVVLNDAPLELAYAVIAQGRLLYQRTLVMRVDYEASVMSRYSDYLPVLRGQREDILRGEEHEARVQRYRAALRRAERAFKTFATSG